MLGRRLSKQQWVALVLLAIGVADIQIMQAPAGRNPQIKQKPLVGLSAVLTMCFTSAFAGQFN